MSIPKMAALAAGTLALILTTATMTGCGDAVAQAIEPVVTDPVGVWFGRALPDDPATSPFPEVVMIPQFFADGNLIASDSVELLPHGNAHGRWIRVSDDTVRVTFLWQNLSAAAPNGYGGAFRVVMTVTIPAGDPDSATGNLVARVYGPMEDPLDPMQGADAGSFTIVELRRLHAF